MQGSPTHPTRRIQDAGPPTLPEWACALAAFCIVYPASGHGNGYGNGHKKGNRNLCAAYTYAVRKTCPWCLETLPVRHIPAECPHCGRELGEDAEPKALELRYARVEARQSAAYRKLLTYGAPLAAVIALVMPFAHVGALAVVPLLLAVHLVTVRVLLVRDAQRLLRPVRRLLNRWLARFSFLWIGIPGYGAMTVPVIGVLVGVGTFALLTSIVQVSTAVSLERERAGKELARWEKVVPIVLAVISIGLILLLIGFAVLFGWSVMAIVERMQAPSG